MTNHGSSKSYQMVGSPSSLPAFYLGTHMPNWLASAGVPLFVSHRRLARRRTVPRAAARWALDSGGFSELSLFGQWRTAPRDYARAVRWYMDDIGMLDFAAIQDYMCEPFILNKTGLSVAIHQRLTIENYLTLRDIDGTIPWLPVVQGYEVGDYLDHVDMYAKAGIHLAEYARIGVGSVCRRQAMPEAIEILESLAQCGLKLHAFGFKKQGLPAASQHIHSADSMAWSIDARLLRRAWCDSDTHINCANCLPYALHWRSQLVGVVNV